MTRKERAEDEADGFTPHGTTPETVESVPTEVARNGYLVYRAKDGFEAAVPVAIAERCVAWGLRAEPNEWFGLIVGKLCKDGDRSHVVVLGVVPDPDAKGEPHAVETTPESEFKTRTSARLLYPDGIVLGWVHGHIRHGVRFSPTDRATQRTWTQPHSLGIVVDPWTPERLSVYRGPIAERLELAEVWSLRDRARPKMPSLSRRVRAGIASAVRRRVRAIAWLAAVIVIALLGLGVWRVDARLAALEGASAPTDVPTEPDGVTELQNRVIALDEEDTRAVPALTVSLAPPCRIILDNPEMAKDPVQREWLTRSCAAAVSEAEPTMDHVGVCVPSVVLEGGP